MMEIDDISSWVLQPDLCRCCLSGSGTWDLTAPYITEAGVKEVFATILKDCMGISLSYMKEMDCSRLVCDVCVNHLRDASSFHDQVVRADKKFSHYQTVRKDPNVNISDISDKQCSKRSTIGENAFDDNSSSTESRTIKKQRHRVKLNTKRLERKQIDNDDCDSDTPIAKLKNFSLDIDFENSNKCIPDEVKENRLLLFENKVEINLLEQQIMKPNKNIKQISERKRVIQTCSIVLIETTACPFRHHKSWFQCFFCTNDFMEINLLRHHITQSHPDVEAELKKIKRYPRSLQIEISNLECRHCHSTLIDVETMASHFVEKHNKVIYRECIADYKVNSSPYTCHICEKEFHVFRTLTTHLNVHYANCICDVCGKSFLNSKRLKVHKRTHENGNFPCNACGKILKTKTSQSNHIESAHSKRVIKCQICFKPMKHYNDRIKHMSEVHNITHNFKCPFCDRVYNIKHYLATHIRQTHGHKNKKCTVCSMAFITNHGLKKHMLKHSGDKPFNCNVCSKSYARSYTLREHMRTHENDKRALGIQ